MIWCPETVVYTTVWGVLHIRWLSADGYMRAQSHLHLFLHDKRFLASLNMHDITISLHQLARDLSPCIISQPTAANLDCYPQHFEVDNDRPAYQEALFSLAQERENVFQTPMLIFFVQCRLMPKLYAPGDKTPLGVESPKFFGSVTHEGYALNDKRL